MLLLDNCSRSDVHDVADVTCTVRPLTIQSPTKPIGGKLWTVPVNSNSSPSSSAKMTVKLGPTDRSTAARNARNAGTLNLTGTSSLGEALGFSKSRVFIETQEGGKILESACNITPNMDCAGQRLPCCKRLEDRVLFENPVKVERTIRYQRLMR